MPIKTINDKKYFSIVNQRNFSSYANIFEDNFPDI